MSVQGDELGSTGKVERILRAEAPVRVKTGKNSRCEHTHYTCSRNGCVSNLSEERWPAGQPSACFGLGRSSRRRDQNRAAALWHR